MSNAPPNLPPSRGKHSAYRPPACIFCGTPGEVTLEHFLPVWTQEYLPLNEGCFVDFGNTSTLDVSTEENLIDNRSAERRFDFAHLQVPAPCKDCNTVWMSKIEDEAKPILVPIFQDQARVLSVADQAVLAKWLTLRMIVGEFLWPDRAAVSPARRAWFRVNQRPFEESLIFIGRYATNPPRRSYRSFSTIAMREDPPARHVGSAYATFHLGPLVATVLYVAEPTAEGHSLREVIDKFRYGWAIAPFMPRIHAASGALMNWPPAQSIPKDYVFNVIRDAYKFGADAARDAAFKDYRTKKEREKLGA